MNVDVKDGAYGLCVLDQHILVGTNTGNIAFFSHPDFGVQELSPSAHKGMIYEVVRHSTRQNGYNVMSLGCDNLLKIWNVQEQEFCPGASTLFFEETCKIGHNNKQITSVDVLA